jgi:hypothetical protein
MIFLNMAVMLGRRARGRHPHYYLFARPAPRYVLLPTDAAASESYRADIGEGVQRMRAMHTLLKEGFGHLDRNLVRSELLSENGVHSVSFDSSNNALSIEYDPQVVDDAKLVEIMSRYGVYPEPLRTPHGDRPREPHRSR